MDCICWEKMRVTGLQLLTCTEIIYLAVFGRAVGLYSLNPSTVLKILDIYLVFVVSFTHCAGLTI